MAQWFRTLIALVEVFRTHMTSHNQFVIQFPGYPMLSSGFWEHWAYLCSTDIYLKNNYTLEM